MTVITLTDVQVQARLKTSFGFDSFRPLQADIIRALLDGRDVFALMPTGGGKSLCYQLPALLLDGLAVVVSPLIALMKDQVDALQALGLAATFVNSSLESAEVIRRQSALIRGELKLLYVSPERLMQPGFLNLLGRLPITFFAIDEAHCISEWGHDFRPEYRELARLRELFPGRPLGAFTATATSRVQTDVVSQLGLQGAASFRGSFNRANLYYEVRPKQQAYRQLVGFLRERGQVAGIIYCRTRDGTEDLALKLRDEGFSATAYHAGLPSEERRQRQEAFSRDDVRIVVATIAFGMGIDKPDVRFVVHYDLPRNLEGYYQESGRAGRDGEPSDCLLFYSYADATRLEYFIKQKPSPLEQRVAREQLERMVGWAEGGACRRRALLAYFDEQLETPPRLCCDACREPPAPIDCTVPAQMLLSCVRRTGERFGAAYLVEVLRGAQTERILRNRHHELPTHGIGRDRTREEWQRLVRELLRAGYLLRDEEYNVLTITERGQAVLKGEPVVLEGLAADRRALAGAAISRGAERLAAASSTMRPDLYERLVEVRKQLADERGVPPYVIFGNSTLRQLATDLPTSALELRRIQGVGQFKAVEYGPSFQRAIREYLGQSDGTVETGLLELSPTVEQTLALFRQGSDVEAIAAARGLAPTTIVGHLISAIRAGEAVGVERLVSAEKRLAIEAAIVELGPERLQPIKEQLGDDYSYDEIRLVRAQLQREPDA